MLYYLELWVQKVTNHKTTQNLQFLIFKSLDGHETTLLEWGSFFLFVSGNGPIPESRALNYVLKCSFSTKDLKLRL